MPTHRATTPQSSPSAGYTHPNRHGSQQCVVNSFHIFHLCQLLRKKRGSPISYKAAAMTNPAHTAGKVSEQSRRHLALQQSTTDSATR